MKQAIKEIHGGRVSISIYKTSDYADIVFYGNVSRKLLDHTFIQLIEDPEFHYNLNAIYDYTDAFTDMEMSTIEEHAQFVAHNLHKRGKTYKLALVASDTLSVALLEVYKLLISKTSVEAEVFTSKRRAVNWIIDPDS